MSHKNPSPATRFPVNRQDHTQKHPNGYLTPLLKRLINKKITFVDPETQKLIKGKVKHAILWRYILNATQGENQAIEGIFERLDGKVPQKLQGEGFGETRIVVIYPPDWKPKEERIGNSKTEEIRPREILA